MVVLGYTDEKETVAIDLSVDEIVAAGIDPWRLDLFDPDPVMLPRGEKAIYFRKLQDVFFAYKDRGPRVFVGLHDGSQTAVLEASSCETTRRHIRLVELAPSERSFDQLWHEYLSFMQYCPESDHLLMPVEDGQSRAFLPRKPSALEMQGNTIVFHQGATAKDLKETIEPFAFVGEMFTELTVPAQFPERIMWVFDRFKHWSPRVFGKALSDTLLGIPVELVEFILPPDSPDFTSLLPLVDSDPDIRILDEYKQTWCGSAGLRFRRRRGEYHHMMHRAHVHTEAWVRWNWSPCTVYSIAPNSICGSKIALYDIASKKARLLCNFDRGCENAKRNGDEANLKDDGFRILQLGLNTR